MAGARQLLRELMRERRASFSYQAHLPRPFADFSHGTHEHEPLLASTQQAIYLHSSSNDEEQGSSVLGAGMPNCLSRVMGSLREEDFIQFSPRGHVAAFSGDSCRSFCALHMGSSAFNRLSLIRAGGTPRHLCCNGHSPAQVGRYSSTVSGQQLEGELGNLGGNAEGAANKLGDGLNAGGAGAAENLVTPTEVWNAATADVAEKLVTPGAQAISEVSAIIGDCSYPTAFLQLFIENLHANLGLPWWGAIVAATIGIRLLCLPLVFFQMKSTAKLTLMRPEMEKITAKIKDSNHDPRVAAEGREQMLRLFKQYNTTPVSPFAGALLQAPVFICFFFAIQNMCERLESFKDGGLLLFTDLTAKDTTYILPIILSATMLLTVELNAADGMEGNPLAHKMKFFMRIFSVALFPISLNFEMGLFFYWIPSNYFSLFQSLILKKKEVKEFLGIPLTEHLAPAVATPVVQELTGTSTELTGTSSELSGTSRKSSVKRKLSLGRSKSKGSHRK